jgi:hypothetical protein
MSKILFIIINAKALQRAYAATNGARNAADVTIAACAEHRHA